MNYKNKQKKNISNSFLIGKKAICDGLKNNLIIKKIYLDKKDIDIKKLAKNIPIEIHPLEWFNNRIKDNINHQGALALVDVKNLYISMNKLIEKLKVKKQSFVLILDRIMDPRNFGAILRSALAANVDAVIFKTNNQVPINTTVIKTSMGAVFSLNLLPVANLSYILDKLQKIGFWSVASCLCDDSEDYRNIEIDKIALIVGNEDEGISPLLIKNADYRVKIPINKKIDSLNVSVATGILLFQYKKN